MKPFFLVSLVFFTGCSFNLPSEAYSYIDNSYTEHNVRISNETTADLLGVVVVLNNDSSLQMTRYVEDTTLLLEKNQLKELLHYSVNSFEWESKTLAEITQGIDSIIIQRFDEGDTIERKVDLLDSGSWKTEWSDPLPLSDTVYYYYTLDIEDHHFE